MGKITVSLSDETEQELRAFIAKKPQCKLDEVVEASVKEYIEKDENGHIGSNEVFYSSP
jgi:metal-responsive CopG/Arc/MetJ family transcriptional regulator